VVSFVASGAQAASMTMMQFGSFETRVEAEKRLAEVSKKHAAELGNLPSSIREVKLPPDNLTVYRTQAGPVESRAVAQNICSKLASSGDECYIVQTAMVAASEIKKPEVTSKVEPAMMAPVAAELNEAKKEAVAATPKAPDLTSKLSSLQGESDSASTLPRLSALRSDAPATGESVAVTAEPSIDMKASLDKAVQDEASAEQAVVAATKQEAVQKPKRSFWSRLNPFSDDEPKAQAMAEAKPEAPKVEAAPIEQVSQKPIEAPIAVAENMLKAEEVAHVAPSATAAPIPAAEPVAQPVATVAKPRAAFDSAPVIMQAAPMQLPPPPAPLKARDRELLMAQQQIAKAQPESLSTPPAIVSAPTVLPPVVDGSVQVEEAKRVPVTQANDMPAAIAVAPVAPVMKPAPLQPDVALSPSATNGQKTVWAQVGPFSSSDEALAFWVNYRQANPDFPVVRVRTTSAYQQQLNGVQRTWLRVGPVMREAFAKALCASITPESKLRCGVVSDLGIAVQGSRSGNRHSQR
jgi:hypothetical protein